MAKPPVKQKYIESPEKLLEHFDKYRHHIKNRPIIVKDWVGKDADMVEREKERPLTMDGFSAWLFEERITGNIRDYFGNKGGAYETYSDVCYAIKEIIRADQIEGGMAGIYNPSITQRLNGLVDKTDNVIRTEQPLYPDES